MVDEVKTETPIETPETGLEEAMKTATGEVSDDILKLKEELATQYIEDLKAKKGKGMAGLLIGEGKGLKDYLVSKNMGDRIMDNIKGMFLGGLFKTVDKESFEIDGVTYDSIFDYLKPVKEGLDGANTVEELEVLKKKLLPGTAAVTTEIATTANSSESVEEISARRKAVLANLNAVLAQDKKKDIKYNRGGHTSIETGLDCGGLIVYCYNQAGLAVTGNGRELFQKFPSKKLEVDDDGAITTDVSKFQEGDVLIFDSLDPAYYDTAENKKRQAEIIGSEGQKIHPHHFAFIKSFDKEKGIVRIVESNGSQGVTESECSVSYRLNKAGTKKSALHAIHVDYDKLDKISSESLAKMEELPGTQVAA